jgi:hypothetical protein
MQELYFLSLPGLGKICNAQYSMFKVLNLKYYLLVKTFFNWVLKDERIFFAKKNILANTCPDSWGKARRHKGKTLFLFSLRELFFTTLARTFRRGLHQLTPIFLQKMVLATKTLRDKGKKLCFFSSLCLGALVANCILLMQSSKRIYAAYKRT